MDVAQFGSFLAEISLPAGNAHFLNGGVDGLVTRIKSKSQRSRP